MIKYMKLLINNTDYENTIQYAKELTGEYKKPVTFHCYWNGDLIEKHLISIKSCFYFNVFNRTNRKIILWLENNRPNQYNEEIKKYAEIKKFDLNHEIKTTFLEGRQFFINYSISFYSDIVRYVLLYKYSGCWFDLDVLFLRNFDPIFSNYENEVIVYQWEHQKYPNGAIYISLNQHDKMKQNIEFIIQRNRGWGFSEANLTFDLPLDMLVLPCSWFDGCWINNPYNISANDLFSETDQIYTFDNFFEGAFCWHWHNRWNHAICNNSILRQLDQIIDTNIGDGYVKKITFD